MSDDDYRKRLDNEFGARWAATAPIAEKVSEPPKPPKVFELTLAELKELKDHPDSLIFPLMSDEEFKQLVKDIKEHGLLEPIVLCQGMILDGRNRVRACIQIGIGAIAREFDPNGDFSAGQKRLLAKIGGEND